MRRVLIPLMFGLIGIVILVNLGIWQVNRLAWKEEAIARIEAQLAKPPVPLPATVDQNADKYLAVKVSGQFDDQVIRVLSGAKHVGPGYVLVSPLTTAEGRRVLIDRGFIPLEKDSAETPQTPVTITGNLLWPDDRTSATPENDREKNIWFARDVADMAQAMDTDPILIVAQHITPPEPDVTPVPVDTSHIPNDHLNYAITWFALALVWLIMTLYFIRRQTRESKGKQA